MTEEGRKEKERGQEHTQWGEVGEGEAVCGVSMTCPGGVAWVDSSSPLILTNTQSNLRRIWRKLKQAQAGPKAFLGKIIHFSKSHETKIHLG